MNKRGNPKSLVASHPGNLHAVKQGVHSPRVIQSRAAEIASELTESFHFSPAAPVPMRCAGWGENGEEESPNTRM